MEKSKEVIFNKSLTKTFNFTHSHSEPCDYMNVDLLIADYADSGFDLMYAYDENKSDGCVYLGKWNKPKYLVNGEPATEKQYNDSKYASNFLEGITVEKFAPEKEEINRDWNEDKSHENGNYVCVCCDCGFHFIGHKRRVICKVCVAPENQLKEPAIEAVSNSKSEKGDIIAEILGIDKQELNLHGLCNYHINLSDCFSAMDRWHEQHTTALTVNNLPEKEVDNIEQWADKYRKSVKDINPIGYYNEPGYNGFIAGANHIKTTHVPIEEVVAKLDKLFIELLGVGDTDSAQYISNMIDQIRQLIKPQ